MSTPTKAESNAAAMAAQTALINAANALFIAEADKVIADAVELGRYKVMLHLQKYVNFDDIAAYYRNLGYSVGCQSCATWGAGPAELFGYFWAAYWSGTTCCWCKVPCRVYISWK